MLTRALLLVVLLVGSLGPTTAADVTVSKPETVGLSSAKLAEMKAHFQTYIDENKLAGITTLIARKGKVVHFETYGDRDKEASSVMKKDTVFRIYSMTKPITGIAMMMLWEEGKFKLDDPVSKYLPSFRNQKVFRGAQDGDKLDTAPVKREATIRDLMRHTAGLTYGYFGDTPVDRIYRNSDLYDPKNDLKTLVKKLGKLPLLYQPGEAWVYSLSVDVQGRLIEVLSGKSLDTFFKERIFDPLGMDDTGFQVRPDQVSRFSAVYVLDKDKVLTAMKPGDGRQRDYAEKPPFLSGGGGLVSSTVDYWRFAQMVANGGTFDGVRYVKASTVEMMRKDQLPKELGGIAGGKAGLGFGLDFAVVNDVAKNGGATSKGEYFWGGYASTLFWIDPEEEVVAVLMTNFIPSRLYPLRNDMRKYVYGALADAE